MDVTGAWDTMVAMHPCGWFWHTRGWLEYCAAFDGGNQNLSWVQSSQYMRVAGICPLVWSGGGLSGNGDPLAWPLALEAGALHAMLDGIDQVASARCAAHVAFRGSPLAAAPDVAPFLARGYQDVSWRSRVVDLTQSEEVLWRGLRKSYKPLIHKIEREWEIVADGTGELAGAYAAVHRQSRAGEQTPRPARTYEFPTEWIRNGHAFLVGAQGSNGWVAFAYVFLYKGGAYYGSGPSLVPNVQHAILWRAVLEAKRRGATLFELGWAGRSMDRKERAIEFFKAGFGGVEVPLVVVEKRFG